MFLFNTAAARGSQLRNFNLTSTNERLVQVTGAPDVVIDNNMLSPSSTFEPIYVVNSDNVTVSNNIINGGNSTFGIYYANSFTWHNFKRDTINQAPRILHCRDTKTAYR